MSSKILREQALIPRRLAGGVLLLAQVDETLQGHHDLFELVLAILQVEVIPDDRILLGELKDLLALRRRVLSDRWPSLPKPVTHAQPV